MFSPERRLPWPPGGGGCDPQLSAGGGDGPAGPQRLRQNHPPENRLGPAGPGVRPGPLRRGGPVQPDPHPGRPQGRLYAPEPPRAPDRCPADGAARAISLSDLSPAVPGRGLCRRRRRIGGRRRRRSGGPDDGYPLGRPAAESLSCHGPGPGRPHHPDGRAHHLAGPQTSAGSDGHRPPSGRRRPGRGWQTGALSDAFGVPIGRMQAENGWQYYYR